MSIEPKFLNIETRMANPTATSNSIAEYKKNVLVHLGDKWENATKKIDCVQHDFYRHKYTIIALYNTPRPQYKSIVERKM
jgi:hypothetical protein